MGTPLLHLSRKLRKECKFCYGDPEGVGHPVDGVPHTLVPPVRVPGVGNN